MKLLKEKIEKMKNKEVMADEEAKASYEKLVAYYSGIEIMALREIGKAVGLKAATSCSKKELVEQVALMQASNLVRITLTDGKREEITDQEALLLVDDYKNRTYVLNPVTVEGIIEIFNSEAWIRPNLVKNDKLDVFVSMRIVNDYDLRDGDFVRGLARGLPIANRLGMYKIERINDEEADEFLREEAENRVDKKNVLICSHKDDEIFMGESKLIVNQCDQKELISTLRICGMSLVGLMLDSKEGQHENHNIFNINTVNTLKIDKSIDLVLSRAKRLLELKKECVIIVDNADSLDKASIAKLIDACGIFARGSISCIFVVDVLGMSDKINWIARAVDSVMHMPNAH